MHGKDWKNRMAFKIYRKDVKMLNSLIEGFGCDRNVFDCMERSGLETKKY